MSTLQNLLSLFDMLYIDEATTEIVIEIRKANKIKLPDAIICATAIRNNSILLSSDIRLKAIKNLNLKLIELKINE